MTNQNFARFGVVVFVAGLALAGCSFFKQTMPPPTATAESTAATLAPTQSGQPTVAATEDEMEMAPTPSPVEPPTAAPPELGPVDAVPPLAVEAEIILDEVRMLNATTGWAIGGNQDDTRRLLRTNNGGISWYEVTPPLRRSLVEEGFNVEAVVLNEDRAQFMRYVPLVGPEEGGGSVLVVWRTEDAGVTWQASQPLRVPFLGSDVAEPYMRYGSGQVGWILARRGGVGMHQHPVALLRTNDGGASWAVQHGPFDAPGPGLSGCIKSGMTFVSPQDGLLTISECPVEGAEVLSTRDGGETWTSMLLPAPAGFEEAYQAAAGGGCHSHSPHAFSADEWFVGVLCRVFDNGDETRFAFLYSTQDGGQQWRAQEIPEGELQFLNPDEGWALGREIHLTRDGGANWELRKTVFWDGDFVFVNTEQGWAVAQSDQGEVAFLHTRDGAATWQELEPALQKD
ncbi:MAG: WD40/YVTN/BNR-like repeat-containing protein [Anaerolineales bacterium]